MQIARVAEVIPIMAVLRDLHLTLELITIMGTQARRLIITVRMLRLTTHPQEEEV